MKRLLASVSLVAVTTTAALAVPEAKPVPKPAPAHAKPAPISVAPADEYFGKLKLSVLGIRNTIKDVGANLDIDQARWSQLASKAAFAEDAMHDWEKKYPKDSWLAKSVFALERMYAKLDTDEGRHRAIGAMQWLVHDFPSSWYGRTGKKELAQGKVGRPPEQTAATSASPAPLTDTTVVVPAAQTSAAPAVAPGTATGSVVPVQSSAATAAAAATAAPLPAPSPGGTLPQR